MEARCNGVPIQNNWNNWKDVPSRTQISDLLSNDLKRRGFIFVGFYYLLLYDASNWNGK